LCDDHPDLLERNLLSAKSFSLAMARGIILTGGCAQREREPEAV
jgi:hypothetical protein